jgi:DNA-binding transcriptional MerR regulator
MARPVPTAQLLLTSTQAAERTGLTPRAIRYYEERGLIHPVARSKRGVRYFSDGECRRLGLIRDLSLLGVPLAKIRRVAGRTAGCETGAAMARAVRPLLEAQLGRAEEQAARYRAIARTLRETLRTVDACGDCGLRPGEATCLACPKPRWNGKPKGYIEGLMY